MLILKKIGRILVAMNAPEFRWNNTKNIKFEVLRTLLTIVECNTLLTNQKWGFMTKHCRS